MDLLPVRLFVVSHHIGGQVFGAFDGDRMIGFSLADATPGDYEIVMRVKDELSGKSLELHEPFSVTPALSSVPAAPSSR